MFFYDAKVYKVGFRRHRLASITADEVEIVNALQIQSADEFVYFHEPTLEREVYRLVALYGSLRVPIEDCLQALPSREEGEELLYFKQPSVKFPRTWAFCRLRRHVNAKVGDRRDPAWTAMIDELMDDFERNPSGGDFYTRVERILADPNSLKNIRLR